MSDKINYRLVYPDPREAETNPTRSAIENSVKKARHQAVRMVLHVLSDVSRADLLAGIKSKFFFYKRMEYIWLVWKDELFGFSRTEIFDSTIDQKIK
jgi:hypothetical protein